MSYKVRINKQVISVASLEELLERAARWQRLKISIDVAEENTCDFVPLEQFLVSAPTAPIDSPGPPGTALSNQAGVQTDIGNDFSNGIHPNMFKQKSNDKTQTFTDKITYQKVTSSPQPQPDVKSPPHPKLYSPPVALQQIKEEWHVEHDVPIGFEQFIKPEHVGHKGPWWTSGNRLIPAAGFWITGAARIIDAFLFLITLGIYGIFMLGVMAKGRQTIGQKFSGIWMVKSNNINQFPGYGQLIGLFFAALAFNIPGILFQAFSRRKQGLHHKMCGVLHIEKKHYGSGRGFFPYLFAIIIATAVGLWIYVEYFYYKM